VSDHPSELTAFRNDLPVVPHPPVRLGALLGRCAQWLKCQRAVWGISGFGATLGGLLVFSPLIDGGTTQLPVLIIRMGLLVSGLIWLLGRMKTGELFFPQTGV